MIELLGLSAISLLAIKYFTPIQSSREWIVNKAIDFMVKYRLWFLQYPIQVISCAYCFSFWFTLVYTFNIFKAGIVGILTLIIMHVIEALRKYLANEEA